MKIKYRNYVRCMLELCSNGIKVCGVAAVVDDNALQIAEMLLFLHRLVKNVQELEDKYMINDEINLCEDLNEVEREQMIEVLHKYGCKTMNDLIQEDIQAQKERDEANAAWEREIFPQIANKDGLVMANRLKDKFKEDTEMMKHINAVAEDKSVAKMEGTKMVENTVNKGSAEITAIKNKAKDIPNINIPEKFDKFDILAESTCKQLHNEYIEEVGEEHIYMKAVVVNARVNYLLRYVSVDGEEFAEDFKIPKSKFDQDVFEAILTDVPGMSEKIIKHVWQVAQKAMLPAVRDAKRVRDGVSPLEAYRNLVDLVRSLKNPDENMLVDEIDGKECIMINGLKNFQTVIKAVGWERSDKELLTVFKEGLRGKKVLISSKGREYDYRKHVGQFTLHYYCIEVVDSLLINEKEAA